MQWDRYLHLEHIWGTVITIEIRGPHLNDHTLVPALTNVTGFLHHTTTLFSTYRTA